MQSVSMAFFVASIGILSVCGDAQQNPLAKTIEFLSRFQAKLAQDTERAQEAHADYMQWCGRSHDDTGMEIASLMSRKGKLEAILAIESSDIANNDAQMEDLSFSISKQERKLRRATKERSATHAILQKSEAELVTALDMLQRAISVLETQQRRGTALVQGAEFDDSHYMLVGLTAVIDAVDIGDNEDRKRLLAFVQSVENQDNDIDGTEPQSVAARQFNGGSILDVMRNVQKKVRQQLESLRTSAVTNAGKFTGISSTLKASIADENALFDFEKQSKLASLEAVADAQGSLAEAKKSLDQAHKRQDELLFDCNRKASDHEQTMNTLGLLAKVKKMLMDTSDKVEKRVYSFVQLATHVLSAPNQSQDLQQVSSHMLTSIRQLAKKERSAQLMQLASKISVIIKLSSLSDSPFGKIRSLIEDLIAKLNQELAAAAEEKEYCDKELQAAKRDHENLVVEKASITAKFDSMAAASAGLKLDTHALQAEIAEVAKRQAELEQVRVNEGSASEASIADLKEGLKGIQTCIDLLRSEYNSVASGSQQNSQSSDSSRGAGDALLNMLQIVESDIAKQIALEDSDSSEVAEFISDMSATNRLALQSKLAEVDRQIKSYRTFDRNALRHRGNLRLLGTQLAAVQAYKDQLASRCLAAPKFLTEQQVRRASEINGLKEALSILEATI